MLEAAEFQGATLLVLTFIQHFLMLAVAVVLCPLLLGVLDQGRRRREQAVLRSTVVAPSANHEFAVLTRFHVRNDFLDSLHEIDFGVFGVLAALGGCGGGWAVACGGIISG